MHIFISSRSRLKQSCNTKNFFWEVALFAVCFQNDVKFSRSFLKRAKPELKVRSIPVAFQNFQLYWSVHQLRLCLVNFKYSNSKNQHIKIIEGNVKKISTNWFEWKITGQIHCPVYEPRNNLKLKIERNWTRAKKKFSQKSTKILFMH